MKGRKITKQMLMIMLLDIMMLTVSGGLALLARFEFSLDRVPEVYSRAWFSFLPVQIVITVAFFYLTRMYSYVWRSVSAGDAMEMTLSVIGAGCISVAVSAIMGLGMPRSVMFVSILLEVVTLVGMRCSLRLYDAFMRKTLVSRGGKTRIMLIGAGEAARILIRESTSDYHYNAKICCAIDDNPKKWGKYLNGVPIIGGRDTIEKTAKVWHIDQIIFAIPSMSVRERKKILQICQKTGCHVRVLPEIYKIVSGSISLADARDIQMEDLLGLEPVGLNTEILDGFLRDKTVLVTGGGGSIGSELCRQIAVYAPRKIVIFDIYENNAYDIQQELIREYGGELALAVEIGSIRDKSRVYELFDTYRPDVVFHAAAHKHVPLMEGCAAEAVKNNIFGTYHVVRAAEKYGVSKFVMISTDKAVNPTNFMGATKRFCEMILQSRSGETEFCCVRFGNVLGSNGSVVPLFRRQIAEGGPVTITDKRIIRYFMTIPEAAQLVLEAGAMAKQNQIFVLDMGEPVKILSLAENLIRISGLKPYKDIEIREIGLRPGEKLYEELLMRSETLSATQNDKIFVEQQQKIDPEFIMQSLKKLDNAITEKNSNDELIELMRRLVPTYQSAEEVNREAEKSEPHIAQQTEAGMIELKAAL